MGMVRINVVAPDEATAPNTGVITHSSENYNYDSGVFYAGASIIITTIILAVLPIILIRRHSIASVSSSLPVHSKKRSLLRFLALALVSFGITFSGLMFLKNSVNFTLAQTMDESLPVSSDDINVTVALKDEPIYLTIPDTITIEVPTLSGYNLSVYTDALDLVEENNPDNKIAGISPEADTLSENTWGISLTAPENQNTTTWKTVPLETNALTIKDVTEATQAGDTTTVYYGIYITPDLPYGTYTTSFNYHAEEKPRFAILDTGQAVNGKMKSVAIGEDVDYGYSDELIKSIQTADSLPEDFEASATNTISTAESDWPIYIFFDNTDDAGIMYIYSDAANIIMNPDSSWLFASYVYLSEIPAISSWDASSVTDMSFMFNYAGYNATTWSIGDLSSWDTSSVTDMSSMFSYAGYYASSFSLDLSSWDTSKATNMSSMFNYAGYSATTWSIGDLSSWDTSSVTDMSYMFAWTGCNATTWSVGDLSSWNVSSVTNMQSIFNHVGEKLNTWPVGDLSAWDTSSVTDMSYAFVNAGYDVDTFAFISSWDVSSVTNMNSMFYGMGLYYADAISLDLSSWNTSSVTNMRYMFYSIGDYAGSVSLNLSSWDTSNVTDMSYMFNRSGYHAGSWSVAGFSSWDTSNVTDMSYMFGYAGYSDTTTWSVEGISSWNVSSVTNMYSMFKSAGYNATTWSVGNISSWNTSNVTDMSYMFNYAGYNATTFSLDLSSWNTSKVNSTSNMFNCAGYKSTTFSLDISSWNTSNVSTITKTFINAGKSASTWRITIPKTNGGGLNNTTSRLYGRNTSTYISPDRGRSFTLSQ